jgi:hypothetical protein
MANHFFNTSAALKHYRAEVGTARVNALAERGRSSLTPTRCRRAQRRS